MAAHMASQSDPSPQGGFVKREEGNNPGVRPDVEVGSGEAAVVLAVRGGQIVVVAPAGTSEQDAVSAAARIHGSLRLEHGRVLTFEIRRGSPDALFQDAPAELPVYQRAGAAAVARPPRTDGARSRPVREIMTRDVLTASPDMLVEDVAKLLAYHNITGMPVEGWDGQVVGIVSEADVIGKVGITVDDVMSREVISVTEETPIEDVAKLMTERRIRRVPVMAGSVVAGIVSRADIVRAFAAR